MNYECEHYIFIRKDEIEEDYSIVCPECEFKIEFGGETTFFDYDMKVGDEVVDSGQFTIFHDIYISEAIEYKYCLLCNTLKPVTEFSTHSNVEKFKSGHQGECKSCKNKYNNIKNGTRLPDQHT
ncbi:hypothetical protein G4V62_18600 [Bacillaceae bacterium SIJ1]|uniref:hypothetical protein n=1 Tax=Litoribacterium kuwaitense TaxID=1398745 RepID=UPI0013E9BAAC|nr:hypothetical protein [Litoribacterium kuwaitense]NGP46851.1 hypothetical protein [Litoribacterium kuwaitense]